MMAIIIACLALIGFSLSNGLETSLLTLSFSDEKKLVKSQAGWHGGKFWIRFYQKAFEAWRRYPTEFLATILVLNCFFSILWCVLGLSRLKGIMMAPLAVGLSLFLLGELIPKVLARRFPEKIVLFCLPPFYGFFSFFKDTLSLPTFHGGRLARWHLPESLRYPFNKKEIRALLADRELTSDLRPRSRLILESMIEFSSRRVKEATRPAKEVFVLDTRKNDQQTLLAEIGRQAYTRIPVSRDGTLEGTVGILHAKDLLFTFATSGLINLQDILRDCPVVSEEEHLSSVLERFRQGAVHMALVRDKTGKIKGIVSLEDILERIVGEIKDEFR